MMEALNKPVIANAVDRRPYGTRDDELVRHFLR